MKTCLITGATGYLGSELSRHLKNAGWRVIAASRSPREPGALRYSLGDELQAGDLRGIDALVHCAYDFGPSSWNAIHARNVVGTQKLLNAANQAGIKTILTISSISAFPACRSFYGKAKLEIEEATLAVGGMVLRPGLIYGGSNRGMYGKLVQQVKRGRPVPLLVGSTCTQFLIHVDDLGDAVEALLSGRMAPPKEPLTLAHDEPWPLKKLLNTIAQAEGKSIRFIPVPWPLVWLGLRCLETMGLKLAFKSDSVRSLAYQNLAPDLSAAPKAGLKIRAFTPESA